MFNLGLAIACLICFVAMMWNRRDGERQFD